MNYQYTFFAMIIFIFLSVGGWIYKDIYVYGSEKAVYRKELNVLDIRFHELSAVWNSYENVKAAYDRKVVSFDTLKTDMSINNKAFLTLMTSLRDLATRQNISVPSLSPKLEDSYPAIKNALNQTSKHIVRYPVELTIQGDYLTIGSYLEEIITHKKMFNLGRISIDTDIETPQSLTCSLILYAYLFKEE
ncbi:MAG: hypothetical protein HQ509_10475 [Candidatus Marinimicrobia bacterium]|nr:hypothetical protein [Candidatus Neomarinimicrobiota bacterium]